MMDLASLTMPRARRGDCFDFDVADGWQQGRGAFGGLVVAMMVRAIEEHTQAPERALRSLTAEFPGATLVGPAEVHVELLRAGSGVSTVAARLVQGSELRAHAVAVLGRARGEQSQHLGALAPPRPRAWRATPEVALAGVGPIFAQHFEFRTEGPLPFQSAPEAHAAGWIRAREPGPLGDAARIAAHADAWWPALFSRLEGPRPVGTISFTLQIVGTLRGLDPASPYFHRARELAATDGYSAELRELWGEDGRLIALNTQTFAVIR